MTQAIRRQWTHIRLHLNLLSLSQHRMAQHAGLFIPFDVDSEHEDHSAERLFFVGYIVNFVVSFRICRFQDSVPAGSYNDPFLSSACMYVCMHVCMYACMHACMYACMHVCMYACMHVCMYA